MSFILSSRVPVRERKTTAHMVNHKDISLQSSTTLNSESNVPQQVCNTTSYKPSTQLETMPLDTWLDEPEGNFSRSKREKSYYE